MRERRLNARLLTFTPSPETFVVEEIAAYVPSGQGEHTYLWIEKRGLTTMDAVRRLARLLDVDARDVGYAGLKDRHAVTRQWLSIPRLDPERALALAEPDLRVLEARRHGNKLRTGHLRGNRFEVVAHRRRRRATSAALRRASRRSRASGIPNRYGEQRFGATGENAAAGPGDPARRAARARSPAAQAPALGGAIGGLQPRLELRAAGHAPASRARGRRAPEDRERRDRSLHRDVAIDQARVDAGEIVADRARCPATRVMEPPPGQRGARNWRTRRSTPRGATREDFARAGRDLPGARRPVLVNLELGDPPCNRPPSPRSSAARCACVSDFPPAVTQRSSIDCLLVTNIVVAPAISVRLTPINCC